MSTIAFHDKVGLTISLTISGQITFFYQCLLVLFAHNLSQYYLSIYLYGTLCFAHNLLLVLFFFFFYLAKDNVSVMNYLSLGLIHITILWKSKYFKSPKMLTSVVVLHLPSTRRVQSFCAVRENDIEIMMEHIRHSCSSLPVNLSEILSTITNNLIYSCSSLTNISFPLLLAFLCFKL